MCVLQIPCESLVLTCYKITMIISVSETLLIKRLRLRRAYRNETAIQFTIGKNTAGEKVVSGMIDALISSSFSFVLFITYILVSTTVSVVLVSYSSIIMKQNSSIPTTSTVFNGCSSQ